MKRLYLIHGKPGSGKSTATALAAPNFNQAYHFSIGEELRARAIHGKASRHQAELVKYADALQQSLPVPPHLATLVFEECISQANTDDILIDGYPQYADRLPDFETAVTRLSAKVKGIYVIDVPDAIAEQRLRGRLQRGDVIEDEQFIQIRLDGFKTNVVPTITALSNIYPIHYIDGSGTPEDVSGLLVAALNNG